MHKQKGVTKPPPLLKGKLYKHYASQTNCPKYKAYYIRHLYISTRFTKNLTLPTAREPPILSLLEKALKKVFYRWVTVRRQTSIDEKSCN